MAYTEKKRASDAAYRAANPEKWRQWSRDNMRKRRAADPALSLWREAKRRAVARGLDFNIEVSDVHVPDICPLLRTPLVIGGSRETMRDAPALDRIDPRKGYVKGNIWVISHRANTAKQDLTVAEFCQMADKLRNLPCVSCSIWRPEAGLIFGKPGPEDTPQTVQQALPWLSGTSTGS